ncbi:amyloid-beta A4 protein-like [Anneissia japonica]|uniref:amyloid-beta A4 protein-like n=1 Tax=Anneissia japonica TaxID=1529436 RepID=UPI00142561BF|nr:amyloid-beta A4 protein-like [Anneissia japonica]
MARNIRDLILFMALALTFVPGLYGKRIEPRIAMNCGNVNMHIDMVTGQWVPDMNTSAGCMKSHDDILNYCRKFYSTLGSIDYVVEANKEVVITNWCPIGQKGKCYEKHSVTPFRCFVGEFVSDALMVPQECRFSHMHENGVCLSHDDWRDRAAADCGPNNWTLHDYGMLLPCKPANYSGVEFVCCPPPNRPTPEVTKSLPVTVTTKEPITKDPYFDRKFDNTGDEHEQFVNARDRIIKNQEGKMSKVMKDWQNAEKSYETMMKKDPKAAEQMKQSMTQQFQKTVNALEVEAESERQSLRNVHEDRVSALLTDRRTKILKKLTTLIGEKQPKAKAVLHALARFVKAIKKNRAHILNHYQHLQDVDPATAKEKRPLLLTEMQEMDASLENAIDMIRRKPDVYNIIETDIDALVTDDTEHIRPLLREEPVPPQFVGQRQPKVNLFDKVTAPKSGGAKSVATTKIQQPDPAPTKPLKTQAIKKIPGKAIIKEFQSQMVKRPQKSSSKKLAPAFKDTTATKVGASTKFGAPVVALGLACGIIAIIMVIGAAGLIIRHKSRRVPVNQGFVELDPNMTLEQKHIAMMQSNGYENPTYKYFEVDK